MPAPALIALTGLVGGVELEWRAPELCPTAVEVQRRLDGALVEQGLEHASLVVRVVIEPNPEGLALALSIDDGGGATEHEVVSQACETIVDAIEVQTLMAAMGAPEPAPEPEDPPAPEEPKPTPPAESPEPAEPRPPPEPLRGAGWAELTVGGFRVPTIDLRWSVGAGIMRRAWTAELGVSHTPARRAAHPSLDAVAVDVRQWSIVGRGCWRIRRRRLEVPLCGGLEAGAVSVIGVGIDQPQRARGPWVAVLPRVGLTWVPIERFAAGVAVEGYGALVVSPATVQDEDPWFTSGRFGAAGVARLELRLP